MSNQRFFILFVGTVMIFSLLAGCSLLQKKVDPSEEHLTDTGFQFRFPMSGEWYPGAPQNGLYLVAQKTTSDGTSKLAIVRHGPIHTQSGKTMNNNEIFAIFKRDIENDSKGGRASKVKSTFTRKKYSEADCMAFEQSGEDNTPNGAMNMNNEGMICLHPRKSHRFIWMAMSERWPLGKSVSPSFAEDKKQFLNSLKFIN